MTLVAGMQSKYAEANMNTKWIATLLLILSTFTAAGCAGSYRGRYRRPAYGPGYYRYDPRLHDHHHRHDNRDDRWRGRDWERNRPR